MGFEHMNGDMSEKADFFDISPRGNRSIVGAAGIVAAVLLVGAVMSFAAKLVAEARAEQDYEKAKAKLALVVSARRDDSS